MAYNGKPFFKIPRPLLLAGGVEVKTIIDGITLTDKDSLFQSIDSGAADQNIILPVGLYLHQMRLQYWFQILVFGH